MVDTCHYTSAQTHGMTPSGNPNINCGPWVIMMCQCTFVLYNKGTTLMEDGDNGEATHVWGQEENGKSLYFPPNFARNLKLLYKSSL